MNHSAFLSYYGIVIQPLLELTIQPVPKLKKLFFILSLPNTITSLQFLLNLKFFFLLLTHFESQFLLSSLF